MRNQSPVSTQVTWLQETCFWHLGASKQWGDLSHNEKGQSSSLQIQADNGKKCRPFLPRGGLRGSYTCCASQEAKLSGEAVSGLMKKAMPRAGF